MPHSPAPLPVTFSVPQSTQRLLGLTFATAERRPVVGTVVFPGRWELRSDARRTYGVPVEGVVEVKVRESQSVKKGDVLFTVQSPDWDSLVMETQILARRLETLKGAGVKNAELQMQYDINMARINAVRRQSSGGILAADGDRDVAATIAIVAVDDGRIETVSQISGAWCGVGTEVVRAACQSAVWFRADGTLRDVEQVRDGMRGWVEELGIRNEGTVEVGWVGDAEARIRPVYFNVSQTFLSVDNELNTQTRMSVIPSPGTIGLLRVVVDESATESIAIPEAAVVMEGLKRVVFIPRSVEQMEKREITLGVSDGTWVEVFGVNAGERVVVDGVYQLASAAPTSEGGTPARKAAGHFHADGVYHEGAH